MHVTHDLLGQPQLTIVGGSDGSSANGGVCIEVGEVVKPNWCFLLLTARNNQPG